MIQSPYFTGTKKLVKTGLKSLSSGLCKVSSIFALLSYFTQELVISSQLLSSLPRHTLGLYCHSLPAVPKHCFYFPSRTLATVPLNSFPIYYSTQKIRPWTWVPPCCTIIPQPGLYPVPSREAKGMYTEFYLQLSWFSSLRMTGNETSGPPSLREPIPVINLFIYIYIIYIYTYLHLHLHLYLQWVLFLWRTLTPT